MYKESSPNKRKIVITLTIILSISLYLAGVFSGLYANKLISKETKEDIRVLKEETTQDLENLGGYIDILDTSLKNMQLEQTFLDSLEKEEMCIFSKISLRELFNQISLYWDRLPFRLEEYERDTELSEEYLLLRKQYTHISIRAWIIAKSQHDKCSKDIVHGLYFYSKDCKDCVNQGMQLDELSRTIRDSGKDFVMFPIEFNSEETIVKNLKKHYGINFTPAIMINDNVFQGRLYDAKELLP